MILTQEDMSAITLTLKLALTSTVLLMLIGTPIAWWLANTHSRFKPIINAAISIPLVLPPTVLGFYLLLSFSPSGPIGHLTDLLGLGALPFTFTGLVIGSVLYSMPFVVQPIQNAMSAVDQHHIDIAATLGASRIDRFFSVVIPLTKSGFITAFILGFAHTVGEFGVVLMIGGNIQGETSVVSVQIYEHVETLNYIQAHWLSGIMLGFSFVILFLLYSLTDSKPMLSFNKQHDAK